MGAGDHPCCGSPGAGPDCCQGQQWDPGLWAGSGEALGEGQTGLIRCPPDPDSSLLGRTSGSQ